MATPGRNDPCPCGSGKKYKHCCLRKDEDAARAAAAKKSAADQTTAAPTEGPTDKPAAAAQEAAHGQATRPAKHATKQPWKRNAVPGAQKFNIPRRSGGS